MFFRIRDGGRVCQFVMLEEFKSGGVNVGFEDVKGLVILKSKEVFFRQLRKKIGLWDF